MTPRDYGYAHLQDIAVLLAFLQSVYASSGRGALFLYTNDLRVLMEVLARQLTDRAIGDPVGWQSLFALGGQPGQFMNLILWQLIYTATCSSPSFG